MDVMHAFDLWLNGKKLCRAGLDGNSVTNTMIDSVVGPNGRRLHLRVGGLSTDASEFVTWRSMQLRVGDEIRLLIVEAEKADKPRTRIPRDPKQEERHEKAYVRRMAKKFGWKVVKATQR